MVLGVTLNSLRVVSHGGFEVFLGKRLVPQPVERNKRQTIRSPMKDIHSTSSSEQRYAMLTPCSLRPCLMLLPFSSRTTKWFSSRLLCSQFSGGDDLGIYALDDTFDFTRILRSANLSHGRG